MNKAVNFEYEWMADGSLRLRFLDEQNRIIGQQMVAADGILALQLLAGLAAAKATDVKPETLMAMLHSCGIDAGLDTAESLMESIRVRAGVTPEGSVGVDAIE